MHAVDYGIAPLKYVENTLNYKCPLWLSPLYIQVEPRLVFVLDCLSILESELFTRRHLGQDLCGLLTRAGFNSDIWDDGQTFKVPIYPSDTPVNGFGLARN